MKTKAGIGTVIVIFSYVAIQLNVYLIFFKNCIEQVKQNVFCFSTQFSYTNRKNHYKCANLQSIKKLY